MTLEYRDRVMETTTTTGTGTLTLAGAVTGYQSFSAVGNGNTTYFCVYSVDVNGNASGDWEVALGTYTSSGTTLSRTSVLASSNSGSPVSFGAGTKRVICTMPASIGALIQTHASRHVSGGSDAIKLDDLAAPDDNTDLNATTSAHGLLPKLGGGTTNFLRADGTWNAPAGGGGGGTIQAGAGNLGIRATDEGTTAGNTRGSYSVDLQTRRSTATQVASGSRSVIGGGYSNTASGTDSHVGGGFLNTASATWSHIGGGVGNTASGTYSHVGGGGNNTAYGTHSHVGGGYLNTAYGTHSHVGGGSSNSASESGSNIGGGGNNTASGTYSHIGGGKFNTASGNRSHVGGGSSNSASGAYSHIGGGVDNAASGDYSHVGGRRAKATHQGSFVFSDSTNADANSSTTDEMTLRFANGVRILGKFGLNLTAIGTRPHVADPSGGVTQDAEARTAINAILLTLEAFGFHAAS